MQHAESHWLSSALEWFPPQLVEHITNTRLSIIIPEYKASCTTLDHFYFSDPPSIPVFCHLASFANASPISLCSLSTVLRHVVFGLPGYLFPGGVQLSALCGMHSWDILNTCVAQPTEPGLLYFHDNTVTTCLLLQVLGQKMCRSFLSIRYGKTPFNPCLPPQHSEP